MTYRVLLVTLCLILGNFPLLCGQTPEWVTYTSATNIRDIAQEGEYLWLVSPAGLVKFNRYTYESTIFTKTNSGLPSVALTAIAIDHSGAKWVGSLDKGVVVYDDSGWRTYNKSNAPFTSNRIKDIIVDKNNRVWIATDKEIVRYSNGQWFVLRDYWWTWQVEAMYTTDYGSLWVGLNCYQNGCGDKAVIEMYDIFKDDSLNNGYQPFMARIASITGKGRRTYITGDQSTAGSTSDRTGVLLIAEHESFRNPPRIKKYTSAELGQSSLGYNAISLDSTGVLWLADFDYLIRFDGSTWKRFLPMEMTLPVNSFITHIMTDSDGVLWVAWIAVGAGGLVRYDAVAESWRKFDDIGGAVYPDIKGVVTVPDGLWVWGNSKSKYLSSFNNANSSWSKDSTWLASGGYRFDKAMANRAGQIWIQSEGKIYTRKSQQSGKWKLFSDAGRWWEVDRDGNFWEQKSVDNEIITRVYNGSTWKVFPLAESGKAHSAGVLKKPTGELWFPGETEAVLFDGNKWKSYTYPSDGILDFSKSIYSMTCDSNGTIWMGYWSMSRTGLMSFDGAEWKRYDTIRNVPLSRIYSILTDPVGNVWLASYDSYDNSKDVLLRYDGVNWTVFAAVNSPLPSSRVTCLTLDKYANLWIGTSEGLVGYRAGGVITSAMEQTSDNSIPFPFYNQPNPVSTLTTIRYSVSAEGSHHVQLKVFNSVGIELTTLVNCVQATGEYFVDFDASQLPSGVYYYRLQAGDTIVTKQMIVVR